MRATKPKYWIGALVLCIAGALIIGIYLFTAGPENDNPQNSMGVDNEPSVPWFARKWADAIALSDPQERRRLLAEALEADTRRQRPADSLSEEERYFRARALELITLAQDYSSTQDFIERWVAGDPQARMLYHWVIGMIGEEDMPQLYDMLSDETYAANWHNISNVIGLFSHNPASADVLWDYFQRDDSEYFSAAPSSLTGKIYALAWIGKIGAPQYDQVLRQAATLEGAEEIARNWVNQAEVEQVSNRASVLRRIRSSALKGLIYSQEPENIRFVQQLYEQELEYCNTNNTKTKFMSALIDCMGYQDYIEDHGLDFLLMEISVGSPLRESLVSHIRKYSWKSR